MEDVLAEAMQSIEDAINDIDGLPESKKFAEAVFKKLEAVSDVLNEVFYAIDQDWDDESVMEHLREVRWDDASGKLAKEAGL